MGERGREEGNMRNEKTERLSRARYHEDKENGNRGRETHRETG